MDNKITYSILTFIFGNYEQLHEVLDVQDNVEYICVTDNKTLSSNTWKIIYDDINANYTSFRKVIEVRYNPFKYVNTDICIIVDGSIQICKTPLILLDNFKSSDYNFGALNHQIRNTVIDELNAWRQFRKFSNAGYVKILNYIKNKHYDLNYKGLYQVGLQIVKNNSIYNEFRKQCIYDIVLNADNCNDAFRIDQLIYSIILNQNFSNKCGFLPISAYELTSSYFMIYNHNSNIHPQYINLHKKPIDIQYIFNTKQQCYYINNSIYLNANNKPFTIAICNFNTTKLTNACIKSIIKHVKNKKYKILLLDNSDKHKFILDSDIDKQYVKILDNTAGQLINFNNVISQFGGYSINNFANLKHGYSIQFLINIVSTDYLVLFDSDTLLKHDIDFINDSIMTCADIQYEYITGADSKYKQKFLRKSRFMPFIQFFNVKQMRVNNIHFFDADRIVGSKNNSIGIQYDTGGSFFEDVITKYQYATIHANDYIEHLLGSSWAKINDENNFLNKYKHFYD